MEEDVALLFELAEKKYGANNWRAQEYFVNYIYNETQVIQRVDAMDLAVMQANNAEEALHIRNQL